MSHKEQIEAFAGDLDSLIERYELEFSLPNVSVVGVLMLKVHAMLRYQIELGEGEEAG